MRRLPVLSLYHSRGALSVVDDHSGLSDALAAALTKDFTVHRSDSAASCVEHLLEQARTRDEELRLHQEMVTAWHHGASLLPAILQHWSESPRTELTQAVVVGDGLKGMFGMKFLEDIRGWTGHRVLVAGAFDEPLALRAFNQGLIDQFLPRNTPNLAQRLRSALQGLARRPDERRDQIWRGTLSREQVARLLRPDISTHLSETLHSAFVQWVVLGEPFGVLARDRKGTVHWLQLEMREHLRSHATLARDGGMSFKEADEIITGHALTNVELRLALGQRGADLLPSTALGTNTDTYMAQCTIDMGSPAPGG